MIMHLASCLRPRVAVAATLLARLLRARPAPHDRRAAAARGDRESDRAARLQAGADADAGAAARGLQPELAVAQRLARLLQGPARASGRRHPDRDGQHHRQGEDRQRDPAQPREQGGFRRRRLHRQAKMPIMQHARCRPASSPPIPTASSDGKGSVNRQEALQTNVAAVVTQVLPNGNLVVEGKQEVRVNFEIRELIVAGIVRPEDIQSDNTIELHQDRGGAHRLWRPRPDHRRAAAALRPAGARRAAAVLTERRQSVPAVGCVS